MRRLGWIVVVVAALAPAMLFACSDEPSPKGAWADAYVTPPEPDADPPAPPKPDASDASDGDAGDGEAGTDGDAGDADAAG